jgi:hypothetical protein
MRIRIRQKRFEILKVHIGLSTHTTIQLRAEAGNGSYRRLKFAHAPARESQVSSDSSPAVKNLKYARPASTVVHQDHVVYADTGIVWLRGVNVSASAASWVQEVSTIAIGPEAAREELENSGVMVINVQWYLETWNHSMKYAGSIEWHSAACTCTKHKPRCCCQMAGTGTVLGKK